MLRCIKISCKIFALIIIIICFYTSQAEAMPAIDGIVNSSQPNGTPFESKLNGDEWNNWTSTPENNVIIQDSDGYWKYAEVDFGELKPSDARVAIDPVPGNAVQSSDWSDIKENFSEPGKIPKSYYASASPPPSATVPLQPAGQPQKIVVLLVSFTNATIQNSDASWSAKFFGDSGKTVKNFYKQNSADSFYFTPAAETSGTANDGIIRVTLGYSHPNTGGSTGDANRLIVKNALIAADPNFNFASFDSNGNGYIDMNELHIVTIIAGYERSYDTTSPSVWGHRWSLGWSVPAPQLDGKFVAQTPYGGYTQQGENHGSHMATIGILCHELSHDLGMFDEYDTNTGSSVVGASSLMDGGSWGRSAVDYPGGSPAHLDPWAKSFLGFMTPINASSGIHTLNAASAGPYNALKVATANPDQYFLIENRNLSGYDAGLYYDAITNGGVAIWHIDEAMISAYKGSNTVNNSGHNPGVWLEKSTSTSDPYYRNGGPKDTFNNTTTPNSKLWDGTTSNVSVTALDPTGIAMQVLLGNSVILDFSSPTYTVNENSTTATITVNRSADTSLAASVVYATSNGTATAGTDYTAATGTLNFAAGETSKTFTVNILEDSLAEGNEMVNLTLSAPTNGAVLGTQKTAVLTIADNDTPLPVIAFFGPGTETDFSINEMNVLIGIKVCRTGDTSGTSTVHIASSDGTATEDSDYIGISETITFLPGETEKFASGLLHILDDSIYEGDETFTVTISNPTGATLGSHIIDRITIIDNETAPTPIVQFSSATYSVGEAGGAASITVTRAGDASGATSINYATSNGTATAGTDYTATPGTLNFAAGEASKTFSVPVVDDSAVEGNETVNLTLSGPVGATLGTQKIATLTITDNDSNPSSVVELSGTGNYSVTEANTSVIVGVTRTGDTTGVTTVNYTASNGTATSGQDYTVASATVTFNAGETSKTFDVNILDDAAFEGDETINLTLSNPVSATLGTKTSGVISITDNETSMVRFSSSGYNVTEGGTATVTVTVQRTGDTSGVATVNYTTGGGTATAGSDYTPTSGTLTFNPGDTTQNFIIATTDDSLAEGSETINLNLSTPVGSSLTGTGSQSAAVLTITDDDSPSGVIIDLRFANSWTWVAVPVGDTKNAILNGIYSDGSQGDITALADWSSSNPEVATVAPGGVITGNGAGATVITATFNGLSMQITVMVR